MPTAEEGGEVQIEESANEDTRSAMSTRVEEGSGTTRVIRLSSPDHRRLEKD